MIGVDMIASLKIARIGLAAGLLALVASCTTARLDAPGAPEGPPANAGGQTNDPAAGFANMQSGSEEDFILNVGRRTYFTENSAALDSTAKVTLDNQANFLLKYPQWFAKIQGFADDSGNDAKLTALSKQRADAVMAYLVSKGVPSNRIWAKGYGKERVVRECTERSCKVQNRRVITNLRESRDE